MKDLAKITVTLAEPVAAGKRLRTDFVQDTYDHLPGTVLRGALAARHLNEAEEVPAVVSNSEAFLETFEGEGSFGPLHNEKTLPLPLSVKQHKYALGSRCGTVWWDQVYRGEEDESCGECRRPLEFSKGEPAGSVRWQRRTRPALDEEGVARQGQLFTQNSLDRETRLSGWLHGPALRALSIGEQPIDVLYFGGRTKHQGAAMLHVDAEAEPEPVEQNGNTLILRLLGPGVFVDEYGFPSLKPDLDELSDQLGVEAVDFENCWTRWCEIEGWHAASGLPKPVERAVQPGSTYLIRCAERADEQARKRLMARGIGLRRREGFGALYSGQRSLSPSKIADSVANMRIAADQATYVPMLRERAKRMLVEPVEDEPFRDRLGQGDDYARGLRKLLDIVDPKLFGEVLEKLEPSS